MQHLETCLPIAEAERVLLHLVMFLTVFFYWMYEMKYIMADLFIALLVEKCTTCESH